MKVLQDGNSKSWEIRRKCKECGAILLISEDDISVGCDEEPKFTVLYDYSFKCPCCDGRTYIAKRGIPEEIRDRLIFNYHHKN